MCGGRYCFVGSYNVIALEHSSLSEELFSVVHSCFQTPSLFTVRGSSTVGHAIPVSVDPDIAQTQGFCLGLPYTLDLSFHLFLFVFVLFCF